MSGMNEAELLLKKAMERPGVGDVMRLQEQYRKVIEKAEPYLASETWRRYRFSADTASR